MAPYHQVPNYTNYTYLSVPLVAIWLTWRCPCPRRAGAFDLCQTDGCKLMPHDEVERPFIERRLAAARTQKELDRAWGDFKVSVIMQKAHGAFSVS